MLGQRALAHQPGSLRVAASRVERELLGQGGDPLAEAVGELVAEVRAASAAAMMSATSAKSSSPNPRVARAGVPIRRPEETIGGRGSNGTALRLTVMPIRVQPVLALLAVELGVAQVDQHQVHVGAAGDHGDTGGGDIGGQQPLGEDLGAPSRVRCCRSVKARSGGELEGHGLGGDHVLERAALLAGEDGAS